MTLLEDVVYHRRHDVLRILFKYEDNHRMMSLIFEQYFVEWINTLVKESFSHSNELGTLFVGILARFLEDRLKIRKNDLIMISKLIPDLLDEKISIMKSFMFVDEMNEAKLNQLNFMIEKDNALFKRLWKELEELNEPA